MYKPVSTNFAQGGGGGGGGVKSVSSSDCGYQGGNLLSFLSELRPRIRPHVPRTNYCNIPYMYNVWSRLPDDTLKIVPVEEGGRHICPKKDAPTSTARPYSVPNLQN